MSEALGLIAHDTQGWETARQEKTNASNLSATQLESLKMARERCIRMLKEGEITFWRETTMHAEDATLALIEFTRDG